MAAIICLPALTCDAVGSDELARRDTTYVVRIHPDQAVVLVWLQRLAIVTANLKGLAAAEGEGDRVGELRQNLKSGQSPPAER